MTRRPAVLLTALLLPALSLLAPTTSSAAPTSHRDGKAEGLAYVALGDSYSAGAGLEPADPTSSDTCDRSLSNYPHVIADRIGADLVDVTCSGARTRDYRKSQADGVPPQLEALGPKTRLVTQTIGGNDGGVFSGAITDCVIAGFSDPQGSPCMDQYGTQFVDKVRQDTFPNLVGALRRVHKAAPKAEVAIIGYPQILPPTEGCYQDMPVATGDVPYLYDLERVLNNVVRRAAQHTGSTYVDVSSFSAGHDACQPVGVRWIEPISSGAQPPVHPNVLGESKLAQRTIKVLHLG